VRDRENSQMSDFDLSEAAFKELYRDLGDHTDEVNGPGEAPSKMASPSQIADSAAPTFGGRAADRPPLRTSDDDKTFFAQATAPSTTIGRDLVRVSPASVAPTRRTRRMRPLAAKATLLIAAAVVLGSLANDPIQAWLSGLFPEKRPPSITGALNVDDLAAGRQIKPGETFSINIPPGKVQIAVNSGQVALVTKTGAVVRPCSNETFFIEVKPVATTPSPLIASCGKDPSLIEAVIPPPPLPSD
jgi:hypothetical protein